MTDNACFAGVDVGSANAKCVVVGSDGSVAGYAVVPSGVGLVMAARKVLDEALENAGVSRDRVRSVVSTGYGREIVEDKTRAVTEITCHGRGAVSLFPKTRLVIDIGGQDSKAIAMGEEGTVSAFEMNDKCAAGTGRFLEVMARALEVGLDRMGDVALEAETPATVSSTCTVFAETEVVSLLAQGTSPASIVAGLCNAVAQRVHGLAVRVGIRPEVTMTGGVSKNVAVVRAMERILCVEANVPEEPLIVGALGAALLARSAAMRNA
jgi:predicted CoA-substrate-specific enzyme activase